MQKIEINGNAIPDYISLIVSERLIYVIMSFQ
jgi:hypothetical protein